MKISYSQGSTFIQCPKMWSNKYIDKLDSEVEGASLSFGSAVDAAVQAMLEGKANWLPIFYDNWTKQFVFGQVKQVFDNDSIGYGHKDLDVDLLEPKDYPELEKWAKELNLIPVGNVVTNEELIALYKQISKDKSNPYKGINADQLKYFNRASWLGLKRKGKIMLNAFHAQFYPKIKKVHAVQKKVDLVDPHSKDSITGFVDMVVEVDGHPKPIIFDLKTSSMPYDQHKLQVSPQLTLYTAMAAQHFNTDLVGYVVLNKNIPKIEVSHCGTCNHTKTGRHKTCDNVVNGVRCNGTWVDQKIPDLQVQVMVAQKTPDQVNDILNDYSNIITAMKNGIIWKNNDRCMDHFGAVCPFYNYCHKGGDMTGLKKR